MNALPFALSFLRAHWKLIGAAFLLLALIIQTFRLSATEGSLSAEKAGRQADRATGPAIAQAEGGDSGVSQDVPAPATGTGGPVQIDSETLVGMAATRALYAPDTNSAIYFAESKVTGSATGNVLPFEL